MKDDELKASHDIIQSFPTSLPTECTSFKRWHFVKTLVNVVINIKVKYANVNSSCTLIDSHHVSTVYYECLLWTSLFLLWPFAPHLHQNGSDTRTRSDTRRLKTRKQSTPHFFPTSHSRPSYASINLVVTTKGVSSSRHEWLLGYFWKWKSWL